MITREFIEAANAAAALAGFINPDFRAATNGDGIAYTFRSYFDFDGVNRKGEKMIIEVTMGEDPGCKNSLPRLWYKNGNTPTILRRYWCVKTYITDAEGHCYETYNPQNTAGHLIDFAYMLEATPENLTAILRECAKRFNDAK